VFFAQTAPLIDYYAKNGKLDEVNGEGSQGEIKERILSAIGKRSAQRS
jgi:adenylate kinase family enzyme